MAWIAAGAVIAAILGANAHLAYVAFASQPLCVDHSRTGEADPAAFAAAKSSC